MERKFLKKFLNLSLQLDEKKMNYKTMTSIETGNQSGFALDFLRSLPYFLGESEVKKGTKRLFVTNIKTTFVLSFTFMSLQ